MNLKNGTLALPTVLLLMLCISVGATQDSLADEDPLQTVGCWPFGSASAVAFDTTRDLVYLGSGGGVLILDVNDPSSPLLISDDINTLGFVTGLRYDSANQLLLVAAGSEGLQIWDVQSPAAPQLLGTNDVPVFGINPPVRNVDLHESFALVEVQWIGAASIDISDPENPVLVGTNSSMGASATDIHVSPDGYLHAVGSEYYVRIHIEPDGGIPGLGGSHIGNARVVFGTEGAAYIEKYGELRIIDYYEGTSVTDVGYFYDMSVQGDYAYLGGAAELKIYDVSDFENPFMVGFIDRGTKKLEVSGEHAFLAGGAAGLHIVDVSSPAEPAAVGSYETFGASLTTYLYDGYAYVAQGGDGIVVIDAADPADLSHVGLYDTPGTAYDVMVTAGYAYVADWDGGLRIADVSDPANPVEIGVAELETAYVVTVAGDLAFVVDNVLNEPDWLRIFDVSNPAEPTEVGSLLMQSDVRELDVAGDYLYAAADDLGLRVVDVSDPSTPVEIGSYVAEDTWDVDVRGDYAYLSSADWHGGFITLDITDPANPVYVSNYTPNDGWYHPFDMAVAGDFAYLSDPTSSSGAVVVLYIGDPAAPVELASYSPPGDILDLVAVDSLLYISDGDAGLRIVENTLYSVPGGGVGWEEQESGTNKNLRAVHFVTKHTGWIVGDDGTILKTEDAGALWLPQTSGTGEDLFGISFVDEQTGWVGGRNGVLLKTTDGGESWIPLAPGTQEQFRHIEFLDADLGWAVGGGGMILKTTNGGDTWQAQASGTTDYLQSISFVDAEHGWIAGGYGDDALTLRTTDGGTNWLPVYPPATDISLNSIHFVNQNVGWLSGYDATVFKSTDGGQTWVEQFNDAETAYTSINCVSAINENTCVGVGGIGVEGRSMKTMDGGESWMELLGGGNDYLQSVHFVDSNNGWAVGHYGTILAATTNDGGAGTPAGIEDGYAAIEGTRDTFTLSYNYPNPFNPTTTIRYNLPASGPVSLRVFDISGRIVRVLVDSMQPAGPGTIAWDGTNEAGEPVPGGTYFYELRWNGARRTGRTLLLR